MFTYLVAYYFYLNTGASQLLSTTLLPSRGSLFVPFGVAPKVSQYAYVWRSISLFAAPSFRSPSLVDKYVLGLW